MVEGLMRVVSAIKRLQRKFGTTGSAVVGYTQYYAIYVHENLQAYHPVGQAKFLEQPARQLRGRLTEIVGKVSKKKGNTLKDGLIAAGLFLQRESQKLVPVDTGALRNSAFTRYEES